MTSDPRTRLVLAAERLIAERGTGVPLRDIAMAAGQRNNSAVNYHFGGRAGLVDTVVECRTSTMETERLDLLAGLDDPTEVADLVRILVAPMLASPYRHGSTHYARFADLVRSHPVLGAGLREAARWPATRIVTGHLDRALTSLPGSRRRQRITAMSTALFALAADRERDGAQGRPQVSEDDLVAMLVGLLTG